MYVHKRCDANECLCPDGRNYIKSKGKWKYYRCHFCGSVGTHEECRVGDDDDLSKPFGCRSCTEKQSFQADLSNNNISGDADEENDSNENPCKRKHKLDAENEGKVWKEVRTNDSFKTVTWQLMNPDGEPDIVPLEQKSKMRKNRLDAFLENADFSSKPRPPPWLI